MNIYTIRLAETLSRDIEVSAETRDEALDKLQEIRKTRGIVLDADDFKEFEMEIVDERESEDESEEEKPIVNYVYVIRLQRTWISTDVERFWYYETREDAEKDANKLHGYKVSIEKHYARLPFNELIKDKRVKTRYPNF